MIILGMNYILQGFVVANVVVELSLNALGLLRDVRYASHIQFHSGYGVIDVICLSIYFE